ncbi:MAG: hypothetical protein KC421_04140, partial [Anaerolineales bacterium]|nr:hypothetical protein [Anaerolineales bacterium]
YFLLHWFVAVPVWDRYLLPLVPLLAVLAARGLVWLVSWLDGWLVGWLVGWLAVFLLTVFLLVVGRQGRNGRFPVGGQTNADQGAALVAAWLDDAPYGTVLYDHWYSWQWQYHLFDKRVFVHWFPHPDALAEDLAAFGRDGSPRYLVLPNADVALPVYRAVESGRFRLEPVPLSGESGMILYRVVPENGS